MYKHRWYPTTTLDHQDRIVVKGGTHNGDPTGTNNYEAFLPDQNVLLGTWDQNQNNPIHPRVYPGPDSTPHTGPPHITAFGDYPRDFLTTTGKFVVAGFPNRSARAEHPTSPTGPTVQWLYDIGHPLLPAIYTFRYYGSAFMGPNFNQSFDRIYRCGGYEYYGQQTGIVTFNTVEYLNASTPGASWNAYAPMFHPRDTHNTVLLPDGTILAVGGRRVGWQNGLEVSHGDCLKMRDPSLASIVPELLDPRIPWPGQIPWRQLSAHAGPRVYHSTAVLLPDGRVLVGGGECRDWDYQIYQPPYLTNGKPRPENVHWPVAPGPNGYAMAYRVDEPTAVNDIRYDQPPSGVNVEIAKVVLVRPGSITHHTDMDARYVELPIISQTPTEVSFLSPLDSKHAPRGFYMLFLVTTDGVPSVAVWVWLQ